MTDIRNTKDTFRLHALAVFFVLAFFLIMAGYWTTRGESIRLQETKFHEISAISHLKISQINRWRTERILDARRLSNNIYLQIAAEEFIHKSGDASVRDPLQQILVTECTGDIYQNAMLYTLDGRLLLEAKTSNEPLNPATLKVIQESKRGKEALSDLYRSHNGSILLDTAGLISDHQGHPLAIIILRSNMQSYLFPLIQTWPTPSNTAETLLVKRDGDYVVYLNDLRHRKSTALTLMIPLSQSDVPAVKVVLGGRGMFLGWDYRGIKVLADMQSVPDSPWYMIAKVDESEIMAEARYRGMMVALFVVLSIVIVGVGMAVYYHERMGKLYREMYRSEKESKEAQQIFRTTLYSIGDGVISTDEHCCVRQMNQVAEQLTGWKEEEAVGVSLDDVFEIVNEETRKEVDSPAKLVLREGTVVGLANHTLLIARDGSERPIADSGSPIRNSSGEVSGVVLVFRDQTEERAAEKALLESEERLRALVESAPDAIFIQADSQFVYVNQACADLLGFNSTEEILGTSIYLHFAPETHEIINEHIGSMNEPKQPVSLRVEQMIRKNGEFIDVEVSATPFVFNNKNGTLVFVRDISERMHMEGQLRQAQKMEAVGRLAGGVAHDFNNMLQVINSYAELAMMQIAPDDPVYSFIQEIEKAGQRSVELTRQLLAFARKQTVVPKVLNPNESVAGLLNVISRLIGEDIKLIWKPGDTNWHIKMDPSQLDQILANLAVNARDAISGVGKILIETSNSVFDEEYCHNHIGSIPGEYVQLTMSDDGCGMNKETLSNLFEPFFTTKPLGRGTGLGMAMVYGIIKQNNGFINVYSEVGLGTTFKLYLPRFIQTGETEDEMTVPEDVHGGNETVLVVEDEETVLNLATTFLKQLGYTVLSADNPRNAIQIVEDYPEEIHLLMTDVIMPEMSGKDLLQQVTLLRPGIKSLFMSGYTADVIGHHGVLDEEILFLQKPFTRAGFASKLREALS